MTIFACFQGEQAEIVPDASGLMREFKFGSKRTIPFTVGFLGRMIFSCLVDADYKDTEAFYNASRAGRVTGIGRACRRFCRVS